ncbi:hypothetical protein EJB05_19484, partial [Eragrostis curvula]
MGIRLVLAHSCALVYSPNRWGSQDIIDLKKGYLKHAACDGTRFELVVHYMTFYVATCQGLIGDSRLHPTFLVFTRLE